MWHRRFPAIRPQCQERVTLLCVSCRQGWVLLAMFSHIPSIRVFTLPDGYRCAVRIWETPKALGTVVFVHGILSHGGWYLAICRHLVSSGLGVHFLERRGSGLNLAALGNVDGYLTWLRDLEFYLERFLAHEPVVLCGISWGGQLAAAMAQHHPELLAGVAMLCPALYARQHPNWLKHVGIALANLSPLRRLHVLIPLQDPSLFTDNPDAQQYIQADPLALRHVTLGFARESQLLNRYSTRSPEKIRIPVFMALAGRDRIVDNTRTRAFFDRIACQDKQLIEYSDSCHTLEFELNPERYFDDLTAWVLKTVRASSLGAKDVC